MPNLPEMAVSKLGSQKCNSSEITVIKKTSSQNDRFEKQPFIKMTNFNMTIDVFQFLFKKYKHDKTENNNRQTQNANRCQDFLRRRN